MIISVSTSTWISHQVHQWRGLRTVCHLDSHFSGSWCCCYRFNLCSASSVSFFNDTNDLRNSMFLYSLEECYIFYRIESFIGIIECHVESKLVSIFFLLISAGLCMRSIGEYRSQHAACSYGSSSSIVWLILFFMTFMRSLFICVSWLGGSMQGLSCHLSWIEGRWCHSSTSLAVSSSMMFVSDCFHYLYDYAVLSRGFLTLHFW